MSRQAEEKEVELERDSIRTAPLYVHLVIDDQLRSDAKSGQAFGPVRRPTIKSIGNCLGWGDPTDCAMVCITSIDKHGNDELSALYQTENES